MDLNLSKIFKQQKKLVRLRTFLAGSLCLGLCIPLFFYISYYVLPDGFIVDHEGMNSNYTYIMLLMWPTSIMLMGLHGYAPDFTSVNDISIMTVSILQNVILYCFMGTLFWIGFRYHKILLIIPIYLIIRWPDFLHWLVASKLMY